MTIHSFQVHSLWLVLSAIALPSLLSLRLVAFRQRRTTKIAPNEERVVIIGASSGVGEELARQYASRGARVCVVGRRKELIDKVVEDCRQCQSLYDGAKGAVIGMRADFASVDDMINLRGMVHTEWQGLDTLIVTAGVSALRPLMALTGVEMKSGLGSIQDSTSEGVQHAVDIAYAALRGNYTGPLVSAVVFIPLLSRSSRSPSILLMSSVAAVIPAPTRSVYASTKAASLMLYQALSIEHPNIAFSHFMPSTIEGDFRASAVDGGRVVEANPNKCGLKRADVARRCIRAVDNSEKTVFMPSIMRYGHWLYWLYPFFVENMARKKYKYG